MNTKRIRSFYLKTGGKTYRYERLGLLTVLGWAADGHKINWGTGQSIEKREMSAAITIDNWTPEQFAELKRTIEAQ